MLDDSGHEIVGPRTLLFDAQATEAAIDDLGSAGIDHLLLLQVTFTDASMTVAAANAFQQTPLAIWAVPEPRLGGRLRLNAFCGLNLASHALGLVHRTFSWAYADADAGELAALLAGERSSKVLAATPLDFEADDAAKKIAASLRGQRIARLGERPTGFDTCDYDAARLAQETGLAVDALSLDTLFAAAKGADAEETALVRQRAENELTGLDAVNQDELDRSLRLKVALDRLRSAEAYDAFAIRCWPETFTEYGGAVCGPVAMMGEARVPCACEADVYGAATQLLLQKVADAPVFLADLVDIDRADDTGVVWHCGQAPLSMRAPATTAEATIHTNRKMPLLYEFALKPGRVTFLRLSQARGETKLIIAGGAMLDRPMAFTGTSGVVRFDGGAKDTLQNLIDSGLEHHMALAYGDHRDALKRVAAAMNMPVLEL